MRHWRYYVWRWLMYWGYLLEGLVGVLTLGIVWWNVSDKPEREFIMSQPPRKVIAFMFGGFGNSPRRAGRQRSEVLMCDDEYAMNINAQFEEAEMSEEGYEWDWEDDPYGDGRGWAERQDVHTPWAIGGISP